MAGLTKLQPLGKSGIVVAIRQDTGLIHVVQNLASWYNVSADSDQILQENDEILAVNGSSDRLAERLCAEFADDYENDDDDDIFVEIEFLRRKKQLLKNDNNDNENPKTTRVRKSLKLPKPIYSQMIETVSAERERAAELKETTAKLADKMALLRSIASPSSSPESSSNKRLENCGRELFSAQMTHMIADLRQVDETLKREKNNSAASALASREKDRINDMIATKSVLVTELAEAIETDAVVRPAMIQETAIDVNNLVTMVSDEIDFKKAVMHPHLEREKLISSTEQAIQDLGGECDRNLAQIKGDHAVFFAKNPKGDDNVVVGPGFTVVDTISTRLHQLREMTRAVNERHG